MEDTNAQQANSDVEKAMEGLQQLLDSLGDQGIGSNTSLPSISEGNKRLDSTSQEIPPRTGPDSAPGSSSERSGSPSERSVVTPEGTSSNVPLDSIPGLPRVEGEPQSDKPRTSRDSSVLNSPDGFDRSPKVDTPMTGNSVTFSLPEEAPEDSSKTVGDSPKLDIPESEGRHVLPETGGRSVGGDHKWRDSMNEPPRPQPCGVTREKDTTSAPTHKGNEIAHRQKVKQKSSIGSGSDVDAVSPHPLSLDAIDGSRDSQISTSGSEADELSRDDVIVALKLKEERMQLIDKIFPRYPEKVPRFSAPDGGYGWAVLVASFFLQAITLGLPLSFGVLYVELLSYFEDTNANTAWIGAIAAGFALGSGPIASILCNYLGFRLTCIIGGIVSAVGLFISSFAPNIFMLYASFGVLAGMGSCVSYIPAVVILGYYFDKRRALANGIASSGVAVGTLVYPLLIEVLVVNYTWRGAIIVLSGIALNCCALGLLLRPTYYSKIIRRIEKPSILNVELFSDWRFCLFCFSELLWNVGSLVILTGAADHAFLRGTSEKKSALLLSISGIGGFVGRVVSAFATNPKKCNRLLCLALATVLTAIPMALFTVSDLYPVLVTHCFVYGFGFGCQLGLLATVTSELFTIKKLTSAYGLVMLSDGIGAFLGPIITGVLYDRFKDYFGPFMFGAAVSLLSAAIFFILTINECRKRKIERTERNKPGIEDHYHTEGFL